MTDASGAEQHGGDQIIFFGTSNSQSPHVVETSVNALHIPQSQFQPVSETSLRILGDGILGPGEKPSDMVERMVRALAERELRYDADPVHAEHFASEFIALCDSQHIIMGTPIMTNAGRHIDAPLSACSVLPVNFEKDPERALMYMHAYHSHSIGLGIDLTGYQNPLEVALKINAEVIKASQEGRHERRIGNMGTISVYHPRLMDIVTAKTYPELRAIEWRFNFSIDCDRAFMEAVEHDRMITRTDGTTISARILFTDISRAAASTGDPGLIFLDRLN